MAVFDRSESHKLKHYAKNTLPPKLNCFLFVEGRFDGLEREGGGWGRQRLKTIVASES